LEACIKASFLLNFFTNDYLLILPRFSGHTEELVL
jgi:hypothetical protein